MKIDTRALVLAVAASPVAALVLLVPNQAARLVLGALVFVGLAVAATVLAPKRRPAAPARPDHFSEAVAETMRRAA